MPNKSPSSSNPARKGDFFRPKPISPPGLTTDPKVYEAYLTSYRLYVQALEASRQEWWSRRAAAPRTGAPALRWATWVGDDAKEPAKAPSYRYLLAVGNRGQPPPPANFYSDPYAPPDPNTGLLPPAAGFVKGGLVELRPSEDHPDDPKLKKWFWRNPDPLAAPLYTKVVEIGGDRPSAGGSQSAKAEPAAPARSIPVPVYTQGQRAMWRMPKIQQPPPPQPKLAPEPTPQQAEAKATRKAAARRRQRAARKDRLRVARAKVIAHKVAEVNAHTALAKAKEEHERVLTRAQKKNLRRKAKKAAKAPSPSGKAEASTSQKTGSGKPVPLNRKARRFAIYGTPKGDVK